MVKMHSLKSIDGSLCPKNISGGSKILTYFALGMYLLHHCIRSRTTFEQCEQVGKQQFDADRVQGQSKSTSQMYHDMKFGM